MGRPVSFVVAPSIDVDGVCASQTAAGAGALTINGAYLFTTRDNAAVARLPAQQSVSVDAAGDNSGITFTIKGLVSGGIYIEEVITGPGAGATVYTDAAFTEVQGVDVSAATTGAVTVGTNAITNTPWVPSSQYAEYRSIQVSRLNSPNFTWELQETNSDIFEPGFQPTDANAFVHGTYTAQTADARMNLEGLVSAWRLRITAWVAGSARIDYIENN